MPPLARPFPRFISDSAQESRPYGRWEERLGEAFAVACAELAEEAGTTLELEALASSRSEPGADAPTSPWSGAGADEIDGLIPEFFGHVSYIRAGEEEPADMIATADFTDVTAAENPDWEVDLNDDVIGEWRADGGRGADVTLIWGTPLVRGALAVTAELDGEVLDQAAINEGRFTLMAIDAVHGFGDEDLFLEIKLWNRRLQEIASESLYLDDGDDAD